MKTIACGILVGASLLLAPQAALPDGSGAHSFAGAYESHTGKTGPAMNVSLGADGTATVEEDPGNNDTTSFGRWVDSGDQVTVTFSAVDGEPAKSPMIFQPSHDGLQAVTWNHALWGKVTPPEMKKSTKVKNMYWFTTIR